MRRLPFPILPALLAVTAAMVPHSSEAVFKKLLGKEKKQVVPSVEQTPQREAEAEALFRQAEAAGNAGKATDLYRKLVKNYPHTRYAPEAQYRVALAYDQGGSRDKAFKAYQELLEKYRGTPHFDEALNRQFQIASASHTSKSGGFLGLKSPSGVIKKYEQIIGNAPTGRYAADAQYNIGLLQEGSKNYQEAITAYQAVVDDYPRSGRAPEAQLRIGEIMGATIERGNRNPVSLTQTREAYEDFLTNFPEHGAAEDALMNIDQLSAQEARKNLQVAGFYERQGNAAAAAIYYSQVAKNAEDPALQGEAQQHLDKIAARNPQALEVAQASAARGTSAARLLKARPEYAGPLAPDVVQARRREAQGLDAARRVPDLLNSDSDIVPFLPIEEPDLPEAGDPDEEINIDPIIPPEPEEGDLFDFPVIDAGDTSLLEEGGEEGAAEPDPEASLEAEAEEKADEEPGSEEDGSGAEGAESPVEDGDGEEGESPDGGS